MPYPLCSAVKDAVKGYIHHPQRQSSMFGWDWGPQLPDAGLWRDVYCRCQFADASVTDVEIRQRSTAIQNGRIERQARSVKVCAKRGHDLKRPSLFPRQDELPFA
ncbi:MAG: hypothetical protein MZU97_19960 [Bacillus subtilis]|nr:hypothetical protein [Bacillus subtilis]